MPNITHLTPEELVARWKGRIKKDTLATWRFRKQGPPYTKVGRAVLYPIKGVEQYEEGRTELCGA